MGINSGEVVTGEGRDSLVTGDAVNTAKRLEEAAAPGEILLGGLTRSMVANATELEAVPPLAAKGKSGFVDAWRVVAAIPGAAPFARRLDAPLVGRETELAFLRESLDGVARDKRCRIVTVYGDAGIGKSRLAAEFLTRVGMEARTLTARCLPYGDGITFLPLIELVHSLGGDEAIVSAVGAEPDGALIVERIGGAIGTTSNPASTEETFWAIRRLLETLARGRGLVVCLEDVHWAEPTFLDLLEYVAGWSKGAPILAPVHRAAGTARGAAAVGRRSAHARRALARGVAATPRCARRRNGHSIATTARRLRRRPKETRSSSSSSSRCWPSAARAPGSHRRSRPSSRRASTVSSRSSVGCSSARPLSARSSGEERLRSFPPPASAEQ